MAAFRPVTRNAELVELESWAGDVAELGYDDAGAGTVRVTLKPDVFACSYQALFDQQQEQLMRLLRATELSPEALRERRELSLARPGFGALVLRRP